MGLGGFDRVAGRGGVDQPGTHVGVDQTRRDDVDAHTVFAFLSSQYPACGFHGSLGHGVGRGVGRARIDDRAGDHHDVRASLGPHARQQLANQRQRTQRMYAKQLQVLPRVRIGDGESPAGDAGIADQQIDVAKTIGDGGDCIRPRLFVGRRGIDRQSLSASGFDVCDHLRSRIRRPHVSHDDVRAGHGELPGDSCANAARPTGHQRHSAAQRRRYTDALRCECFTHNGIFPLGRIASQRH
jgi:hypothetical protein